MPRTLPGLDVEGRFVLTSDEFLELERVPTSVAVVGGGAIGCEFASLLSDLGAKVTVLEALDTILAGCDDDVSATVARSFKKRGIEVVTGAQVEGHTPAPDGSRTAVHLGDGRAVEVEQVVVSVGRRARTEGLLSEGTSVQLDERGFVVVNHLMQTHEQHVWAVGDVCAGTPQLAHVAFEEAVLVIKGILGEPMVPVDYERVPWAID